MNIDKNKKAFMKNMLACTLATLVSAPVMAAPELRASLEMDLDAVDTQTDDTTYDEHGFVELGVSGRRESGEYFVAAVGSLRLLSQADGDGDHIAVRDVYIQMGNQTWDAQVGRFEAINLFPLGKDTVVMNAGGVSVYEANRVRGFAGDDGGQIALHLNASENLKFEVATIFGDDDTAGDNATAISGIRPAVTFGGDGFSLTAGYERVNYDLTAGGDVDQEGFALGTNFDLGGANVNLAATHGEDDDGDQEIDSYTANMTYGGFGAGLLHSKEENAGVDADVTTLYLAYTVPLFDIPEASVTFAGSTSHADGDAVTDDETNALRMRFNYTF